MNIKPLALLPAMVQQQQDRSGVVTALSSIAPALASTACCWGPAALSIFGAASGSSSAIFSQISKFRPHFLALSVTMISYSFYKVYGPPSKQEHACCKSVAEKAKHAKTLKINRAVAWVSLGIAVAGASYGRVALPKSLVAPFNGNPFGPVGTGTAVGFGAKNIASSASTSLKLQVEGMHCGGCATKIKRAIESVGGVQKVVVDHKTGAAVVEGLRGGINEQAVKSAIAKLGYIVGGGM